MWQGRLKRWVEFSSLRLGEGPTTTANPDGDSISIPKDFDLHHAASNGELLSVVRFRNILSNIINTTDSFGRTPFGLASRAGYATTVTVLLKEGAELNIRENLGRTSLHYASMRGHTSVIRALLRGVQFKDVIDARDEDDKSPLDLALHCHQGTAVALLIFNGAKDRDNRGKKSLESSLKYGSPEVIRTI